MAERVPPCASLSVGVSLRASHFFRFMFLSNLVTNCEEQLDLTKNSLFGPIPTEFGWFEELDGLYLGGNMLSGAIPSELGNVYTLESVYLHSNEFSGVMPEDLCNLNITDRLNTLWADCEGQPPLVTCESDCCTRCFGYESPFEPYLLKEEEDGNLNSPTFFPTIYVPDVNDPFAGSMSNPELLMFLKSHSTGFAHSLNDDGSPQHAAYLWLGSSPNLESLSDFSKLQRYALAALFFSTTEKNPWKVDVNWGTEDSECNWYGISCTDNSEVSEISLPNNHLAGTIPPEIALAGIGNSIVNLNLMGNELFGEIPTQIGGFHKLVTLNLRSNQFTGVIPTEFGGIDGLESLQLHINLLNGDMPSEVCSLREEKLVELTADCDKDDPLFAVEVACDLTTCCTDCY